MSIRSALIGGIIAILLGTTVVPIVNTNDIHRDSMAKTEGIVQISNSGDILYVGGSGPNNYTKIQDAIDNASDGNTIFVYDDSSPYYENVVIDKSINLIGENRNTTIIDANGTGDVVRIPANGVVIGRFTIRNSGSNRGDAGIDVHSNYNTISENNLFENRGGGIHFYSSKNNHIRKNIILNNDIGISLSHYSSNNRIDGNDISNNTNVGIRVHHSHNNKISGNIITSNCRGIGLYGVSNRNRINNNMIWNNNEDAIILIVSDNNIVVGNNLSNNYFGIYLSGGGPGRGSTMNRISHNTMQKNIYGVMIDQLSTFNFIDNNNFMDNNQSAFFIDSFFNIWFRNYWDEPMLPPKIIEGMIGDHTWVNFDWFPRTMPYEDD